MKYITAVLAYIIILLGIGSDSRDDDEGCPKVTWSDTQWST